MTTQLPDDEYTAETIAAMIAVPPLIIALAVATVIALMRLREIDYHDADRPLWLTGATLAGVTAVVTAALFWWGMYPWKAEYHQWRAVSGTVESVESRLVPAGQTGMQDKYVVTFRGNDREYGVLDTRAATVRPGDTLTITCVRRWQWSGTHGYDCNFVDATRKQPR